MSTVTCPNCGDEWIDAESGTWYDDSRDAYASDVDHADAAACAECYRNSECPDECNEPHLPPAADSDGEWQCPTTGETFYATGDKCSPDWNLQGRYRVYPTLIYGYWYEEPYDEFDRCYTCDEWYYLSEVTYNEDGEAFCTDHAPHNQNSADSDRYVRCAQCRASLAHKPLKFDTDTELTYCPDHAVTGALVEMVAA